MALSPMQMLQMMGDPRLRQGAGVTPPRLPTPQLPAMPRPRTPPPVAPANAPQSGPGGLLGLLQRPGVGDALMAVGMNMMAQADQPGNLAGALGRSLPAGVQAYQQAGQDRAMQALLQQMSPEQRAQFEALDPVARQQVLSQIMSQQGQVVSPGGALFNKDPMSGAMEASAYVPLPPAAPKDERTPAQKDYEYAVSQGYSGTFEQWENDSKAAGAMRIQLPPAPESFNNAMKQVYDEDIKNFNQSMGAISRLRQMRSWILSEDFESGGFQNFALPARQFLYDMFGVESKGLGIQEAFRGTGNQLALFLKPEAMTGQMSDNDLKFLERAGPRLANSKVGNLMLIDYYIKIAEQQRDWAIALDYWREENPSGVGLLAYKRDWYNTHGVFTSPEMTDAEIDALVDEIAREAAEEEAGWEALRNR